MTEQEYIDVRDLSNIIHARQILGQIIPGNQPLVDLVEFRNMMRILSDWEDGLFEQVKLHVNQSPNPPGPAHV